MTQESEPGSWSPEQPPAWRGDPLETESALPRPLPPPAPAVPHAPAPSPAAAAPADRRSLLRDTWSLFQRNRRSVLGSALTSLPLLLAVLVPGTVALDGLLTAMGIKDTADLTAITAAESAALTAWFYLSAGLSTLAQTWLLAQTARLAATDLKLRVDSTPVRSWLRFTSAQLLVLLLLAASAAPGLGAMYFISGSGWGVAAALATLAFVPAWAGWSLWLAAGTLPLVGVTASEGLGGAAAVRRSLRLAHGARLRLFGPYLAVSLLSGLVGNLLATNLLAIELPMWWQNSMMSGVATAIALAISVPFQAIVMTLGYANRRLETEPPTDSLG